MPGLVDFEDKEQVKAFLENVVECKYQCYCEKDPNGECWQSSLRTRGDAWGWAGAAGATSHL